MTPHREPGLTQEDADWLREQCPHRGVEGCDCGEHEHKCDWCRVAAKIEVHVALEIACEVAREYNLGDRRWDDDYTGEDAT